MSGGDLAAIASRGRAVLAHYGVKGMHWGVRKDKVSVKFRPTYTVDERRQAQDIVKNSKKTGAKAVDKEGKDVTRVAQVLTPHRRVVNAVLGDKTYWKLEAGSLGVAAATAAGVLATGGLAAPAAIPILSTGIVGAAGIKVSQAALLNYKVFFRNMAKNGKVKLKGDLTPDEMAKLAAGKAFTKDLVSKKGSATIHFNKDGTKLTLRDREGRALENATIAKKPAKKS